MRLKTADLDLLIDIHSKLLSHQENETASRLKTMLNSLREKQKNEREANKRRAAKNREAGYAWKSSIQPKKSKYFSESKNAK